MKKAFAILLLYDGDDDDNDMPNYSCVYSILQYTNIIPRSRH